MEGNNNRMHDVFIINTFYLMAFEFFFEIDKKRWYYLMIDNYTNLQKRKKKL